MIRLALGALTAVALVAACSEERGGSLRPRTAQAKRQVATIDHVVDGDTIKVKLHGKLVSVRLIGIDTPETHKPGVKVECGGREASANMERLAPAGARVTLTADPSQDSVDRYGRLLAYAKVKGKQLQLEQLYAGWAEVYVYRHKDFARVSDYESAQGVAKRAGRGVWGACSGDFHSEQDET